MEGNEGREGQFLPKFSYTTTRNFRNTANSEGRENKSTRTASRGEKEQIDFSNSRSGPLLILRYLLILKVKNNVSVAKQYGGGHALLCSCVAHK